MSCSVGLALLFLGFSFLFLVWEIEDLEVEHCMCEEERFFRRLMQGNRSDGYGVLPM